MAAYLHHLVPVVDSQPFYFTVKPYTMKNIAKALSLILIAAAIVLASAKTEYKSNETCHAEWNHLKTAHSNEHFEMAQADSTEK